jgi:hypothetical protein
MEHFYFDNIAFNNLEVNGLVDILGLDYRFWTMEDYVAHFRAIGMDGPISVENTEM